MLSLVFFVQALHMPKSNNSAGVYRPKYKKNALLAGLVQRLSAFTSRCRTDKGGRGALEPPPEDGARTKRFDRKFQFRESHTEAETKKTPDRIKRKKNGRIYIYIFIVRVSYHNAARASNMSFRVLSGKSPIYLGSSGRPMLHSSHNLDTISL